MEEIWLDIVENKLKVQVEEHPIVLTEPVDVSKSSRESMTEIMFESVQTPAIYLGPSSAFALYGTGSCVFCLFACVACVPLAFVWGGRLQRDPFSDADTRSSTSLRLSLTSLLCSLSLSPLLSLSRSVS